MKTQTVLLYPFDLGLELDFSGKQIKTITHDISLDDLSALEFEGKIFHGTRAEFHLYRFGVGMIRIGFPTDFDVNELAELSCQTEKISIGKTSFFDWCQAKVVELIAEAEKFAAHRYDLRLKDNELFPVFVLPGASVKSADHFIRQNYKACYGIVAGEPNFERLSDFVFNREPLGNFGYYENELIIIKRFGAIVSSQEAETILDLIALSYAQYWSLKSYHFVLDSEVDTAQKLLDYLPPYYKFWEIPSRYRQFSREALDFGKDKLSIIDSLYNVSTNIPQIDMDWHLRTLYQDIAKVFNIEEMYHTVEVKLDRIEESYNQAREFISTNFFILLDYIFALWLIWGIFDTLLLLTIAKK